MEWEGYQVDIEINCGRRVIIMKGWIYMVWGASRNIYSIWRWLILSRKVWIKVKRCVWISVVLFSFHRFPSLRIVRVWLLFFSILSPLRRFPSKESRIHWMNRYIEIERDWILDGYEWLDTQMDSFYLSSLFRSIWRSSHYDVTRYRLLFRYELHFIPLMIQMTPSFSSSRFIDTVDNVSLNKRNESKFSD